MRPSGVPTRRIGTAADSSVPLRQLAFAEPPDLLDPTGSVAVWFTEPPGAVVQFVQPVSGTTSMAQWVSNAGRSELSRRFKHVSKLTLIFDLRLMTGRDAGARATFIEAAKAMKDEVTRTVVIPPTAAGPLYLASLDTATALLRAFGVRVELESSLSYVIGNCMLRPARKPTDPP